MKHFIIYTDGHIYSLWTHINTYATIVFPITANGRVGSSIE